MTTAISLGTRPLEAEPLAGRRKSVKEYDFRRPDKFSKDHLRALQSILHTFARLLGPTMSSYLRGQVQAQLKTVEQVSYDEAVSQLPNPSLVCFVSCEPLPDRMVVQVDLPVAYAIVDRLLGGQGRPAQRVREITEIEQVLMGSAVSHMLDNFREAWSNVVAMEPKVEDVVFSATFLQSSVPGIVAAGASFDLTAMGSTGSMSLIIPYTVLEPIMTRINSHLWQTGARRDVLNDAGVSDDHLRKVLVPLVAVLGDADVYFQELLRLRPGDLLRLTNVPGRELRIRVGDSDKFAVVPGQVGAHMAVQITDLLTEGI